MQSQLKHLPALRCSAAPSPAGRASTRCCAARAGVVRLLASAVAQRKMQIRAVLCAPPNPLQGLLDMSTPRFVFSLKAAFQLH
jgi:hypothetical protein